VHTLHVSVSYTLLLRGISPKPMHAKYTLFIIIHILGIYTKVSRP